MKLCNYRITDNVGCCDAIIWAESFDDAAEKIGLMKMPVEWYDDNVEHRTFTIEHMQTSEELDGFVEIE